MRWSVGALTKETLIALLREQKHTSKQIAKMTGKKPDDITRRISRIRRADPTIPPALRLPPGPKKKTSRPYHSKPKPKPKLGRPTPRTCLACGDTFTSHEPRSAHRVCDGCKRLPAWHDHTHPDCTINHR